MRVGIEEIDDLLSLALFQLNKKVHIQQKTLLTYGCLVTWLQSVTSSQRSYPNQNLRSYSFTQFQGNILLQVRRGNIHIQMVSKNDHKLTNSLIQLLHNFLLGSNMRFLYKPLRRFSLDHSDLKESVTKTGLKNFKIESSPLIEGYLTKNGKTQQKMHTVVMIHEWWGFNESITKTAEIFSNSNIRVFVPDLYRGQAANTAEQAGHKMSNLNWPKALEDLTTIRNHFSKDSSSVNVVGFCMGGALTFAALSSIQGWKAGGVFYGIPDLNIFRLDKITAKVIAHFGELDPLKGFSDATSATKLKNDCIQAKYPVDVRIYSGANHAFCNQDSRYFSSKNRDTAFEQTRQLIEG